MSGLAKPSKVKKKTMKDYKDDFVDVWPTEKNKWHKQGESFSVHKDAADQLIKRGMATYENPSHDLGEGEKV